MKLVVGGSFQGKLNYAKKTFGLEEGWLDGDICGREEIFRARGVYHFHDFIRRELKAGRSVDGLASELMEKNPEVCIVSNELGYGVVPVEPFDRGYREAVGRTCEKLAAFSGEVHRVVCGVGLVLKGGRK